MQKKNNHQLTVLMSTQYCSPSLGSEDVVGWGFSSSLARYCKVISLAEDRGPIFREDLLREKEKLPWSENLKYVLIRSPEIRRFPVNFRWKYYLKINQWQMEAFKKAQYILSTNTVDLIHQVNMIGFREPGYLYKLDKPFIWGPIGGIEEIPRGFISQLTAKALFEVIVRKLVTHCQLRYSKRVREAFKSARVVLLQHLIRNQKLKRYMD